MICISINQESRRLALVDMLNSAKQCDLLEIRLDRFGMAPEIAELLAHKPAPVIMSCRRQQEGGHWEGTEAERLALLRQCIISKADYVEIELDAADQIKRMEPTKRVISYTVQPGDTPATIQKRYAEAQTKDPDVIKLTTVANTPEQAWPFVQILAKPPVPTVVVGLGKRGIMLTILGKKIEAPWTYAALEKGMEAYPAQPSVRELNDIYHYDEIGRTTRLIGVTGFEERSYWTVAGLNAALAHLQLPARCLPLAVGSAALFAKVIDAIKLASVVVDAEHQEMLLSIAGKKHPSAEFAQLVDLLLHREGQWNGFYSAPQSSLAALAAVLKEKAKTDNPLQNRVVIVVGLNALARTIAAELGNRKASVILASHDRAAAQQAAGQLNCRHAGVEAIPTTMHDALIICDEEKDDNIPGRTGLHPGSLREHVTVMDLGAAVKMSPLLLEAQQRSCHIVKPREVLLSHLELQAKMIGGKEVPREVLAAAIPDLDEE